ncbi:MAG: glycosyltransferase family 9 protein [Muribaculaceae bacterium]|nr:glycosyltransferase family 9 protein [Muribaculaceae bacterium]
MSPRSEKIDNNSSGDILISRFSALGDVAMTLAPIYDACLSNPSRRFILLTRCHPASLFINPPANLVIHPIDTSDYHGLGGLRRLHRELRKAYDITAYADLHDVLRTQILRLLFRLQGGVRIAKVDKGRAARRRLTRKLRKHLVPLTPMSERYADTLAAVGAPGAGKFTSIFPDKGRDSRTPGKKEEAGEYKVAIAPFAAHEGKIYPYDLMEKVIAELISHPEVKIYIFGFGDKEKAIIEQWRSNLSEDQSERVINMAAEKSGLPAELALISECDVMLSMDSANMHLASLAGTRTVSIWGATHPYCGFRPRNVSDHDILQLDMTCRPCSVFGNKKCHRGDYHCLRGISPRRIVDVVLGVKGKALS